MTFNKFNFAANMKIRTNLPFIAFAITGLFCLRTRDFQIEQQTGAAIYHYMYNLSMDLKGRERFSRFLQPQGLSGQHILPSGFLVVTKSKQGTFWSWGLNHLAPHGIQGDNIWRQIFYNYFFLVIFFSVSNFTNI